MLLDDQMPDQYQRFTHHLSGAGCMCITHLLTGQGRCSDSGPYYDPTCYTSHANAPIGVQEVPHFTSALCLCLLLFGYRCRGLCFILHAARPSFSYVPTEDGIAMAAVSNV